MTSNNPDRTDLTPEVAAAMTVNERLPAAGLLADFDSAATARDENRLRTVFTAVHLSEPDIKGVIHTILCRASTGRCSSRKIDPGRCRRPGPKVEAGLLPYCTSACCSARARAFSS